MSNHKKLTEEENDLVFFEITSAEDLNDLIDEVSTWGNMDSSNCAVDDPDDPVGVLTAPPERTAEYWEAERIFFAIREAKTKEERIQMLKDLRSGYSSDPDIDVIVKALHKG